jgi:hypothetical protein
MIALVDDRKSRRYEGGSEALAIAMSTQSV